MTAPVFLVPVERLAAAAPGGAVTVDGPEGRHAVSVRRLRAGEEVVLTDGDGHGARCRVTGSEGKDTLHVEVVESVTEPPAEPRLTVVQALPKGDRGELAVETMTEVGVDAVIPWAASRCVTQWRGERAAKALGRWRSTAREAGKQARRLRFPVVHELMTTSQVVEVLAGAELAVLLHEEGAVPLATASLPTAGSIVLVVGPEGGLTDDEIDTFRAAGAVPHRLGRTVLRTSTAGVAAAASVFTRTGRWAGDPQTSPT